ncbi:crotonase/enoyl-CoA hydratase family protein [Novosphingobium sp. TH158]|uniref:crotonase/enoyl-CoA hydratase family protein n=1 Tax=Novosphingobium sp. TH158 TaxID=2067455 RepID=UPI000C7BBC03|nr:crotonase/enoyl-CoA hydratase family protein [Novosphingobium sp. TH158]PLK27283.1 enoyl-CoA hydratase [Novosphingobium sp. TH158]
MKHEMPATDRIGFSLEQGVGHLRLTRADKLNALDPEMIDALLAAGEALHGMPGLRCLVVSGEGRGFCAGLDLASMAAGLATAGDLPARTHGNANRFQQMAMQFRKLPVPVIAAIHGVCLGGGLQIAAGADIRVTAPDARFCVMELKWGIVPDMGHFALWRGLVRPDLLRELTYTHREFSGTEAAETGFATHCDADPLARAVAIASEIAGRSPHAIRAAKALFARSDDATTDEILMAEAIEQQRLIGSRNQMEAVASQMAGRTADFTDP